MLFNNLLSSRKSIATAHEEIMADQMSLLVGQPVRSLESAPALKEPLQKSKWGNRCVDGVPVVGRSGSFVFMGLA